MGGDWTTGKGDRTRQLVVAHALALAAEMGWTEVTAGRLAQRSGMSKGGLVGCFGSLGELKYAAVSAWGDALRTGVLDPARVRSGLAGAWEICAGALTARPALSAFPELHRGSSAGPSRAVDSGARTQATHLLKWVHDALEGCLVEAVERREWLGGEPAPVTCQLMALLMSPPWATRVFGPQLGFDRIVRRLVAVLFEHASPDLPRPPVSDLIGLLQGRREEWLRSRPRPRTQQVWGQMPWIL